jgi:hypothetical protein
MILIVGATGTFGGRIVHDLLVKEAEMHIAPWIHEHNALHGHIVSVRKSRLLRIAVLGTLLLLLCSFALPTSAALPQNPRFPFDVTYSPLLTAENFGRWSSDSLQTPPPPGLYAAFLTQDGHIRTVSSDNGDVFQTGQFDVIHGESSDFGPAIARDPRSGVLALAFFPKDVSGGETKLVIKLALGPTEWEEDATAWMETQTQSPPAIHYLNDGIYALGWNNGGRIATASFNYQKGIVPSEFESTAALGAPTITSDGDTALMIWQSARQPGVYHSATGSLDGEGGVTWERGSNIAREMTLDSGSTLTLKGRPSITWDGADYWLAATGTIDSGEASGRTIAFLKSRNGQQDWEIESTCLLDVPESSIPFAWLALAIVDNEVRVLVHRANSPPSWLKLMDDSCNVISQLQNSLLTRMQPSMIWSSIPDSVEEPLANALWIEQGPGPILSGGVEGIENRPVAGAVNSIALHPSDPDIAYVGTVSGGVWRTENAQDGSPTWIPLTDNMPSLSIGSISFDPCDEQGNSLFVGTGVFSSGRIGIPAVGIYGTTDEGQTWQLIGDTDADGDTDMFSPSPGSAPIDDFRGTSIRNLVASQCTRAGRPILLTGTPQGIYRGVFLAAVNQWNFLQIAPSPVGCVANPGAIQTGNISSLIRDTENPNTFYAAVAGTPVQIFTSTNTGDCWTALTSLPGPGNQGGAVRLAMSVTPSESGIPPLYAAVAPGGDDVFVFRSTDRGASWVPMFSPTAGGVGPNPGGQAVRPGHFTLAADPGDANIVYVGGDRQQQPNAFVANGTTDFSGNLFIGDWRRRRGVWQPLVGSFANGTAPHADSRHITFDANGNLIEADDGGVYRLRNPKQRNSRRWESMNGNLRITEFYSVAWDSHNDVIFGGTQDNGSVEQLASRSTQWRDARLFSLVGQDFRTAEGDGGAVAVDNRSSPIASVRWTMLNNYFLFYRREYPDPSPATNPGWIFFNVPENPDCPDNTLMIAPLFCGLDTSDRPADLSPTNILNFAVNLGFRIYPIAVNQVASGRIVFASSSVYESDNQGFTWRVAMRLPARAQALVYGGIEANGTPNPEALIAAYGANLRTRQQNGVVTDRVVGTSTIVDIALDPTNWRTVYFLQSNRVFRINDITNPASTRVNVTEDLTDILRSFRTLEVFHEAGETVLIVGGQPINRTIVGTDSGGVARLRNANTLVPGGPAAGWVLLGSGLPNVVVTDLHYDTQDDTLVAGTWGRGAWTIEHASKMP